MRSLPPQSKPSAPFRAVVVPAVCALGLTLAACGKKEESSAAAATPVLEDAPAPAAPVSDADLLSALAPPSAPATPAERPLSELEDRAWSIMREYPDKNAQDLLNVPEVNPSLVEALKELGNNPELQAHVNASVDLAAKFKGLEGPPGSHQLNLDVTVYDDNRTARLLAAVLSGRAAPVVNFLAEELGEASFEFAITDADKTANGISLQPAPNPPPGPPPADPD
jgi:hypothetical protein